IKNANLLITAAGNCKLISDAEKKGYTGFAKTLIAYDMLLNLMLVYDNGIRTDVANFGKLGPIVNKDDALTFIAGQLDDGNTDLSGASIIFSLSGGFAGFDDAAGLSLFNRALAARVAIYRQNWTDALTDLDNSFFDMNGDFSTGVYLNFSS